ncbi:hypothetical protein BG006_001513 [Podila minutissima]|uniref:Uncharacterized protein n=1 Tax=Podila minutissima TaxID=64525 RepID=A0A9P5ST90_9FUNG|nr:hypothetical protein BG006_001513 [Podila minutissima]
MTAPSNALATSLSDLNSLTSTSSSSLIGTATSDHLTATAQADEPPRTFPHVPFSQLLTISNSLQAFNLGWQNIGPPIPHTDLTTGETLVAFMQARYFNSEIMHHAPDCPVPKRDLSSPLAIISKDVWLTARAANLPSHLPFPHFLSSTSPPHSRPPSRASLSTLEASADNEVFRTAIETIVPYHHHQEAIRGRMATTFIRKNEKTEEDEDWIAIFGIRHAAEEIATGASCMSLFSANSSFEHLMVVVNWAIEEPDVEGAQGSRNRGNFWIVAVADGTNKEWQLSYWHIDEKILRWTVSPNLGKQAKNPGLENKFLDMEVRGSEEAEESTTEDENYDVQHTAKMHKIMDEDGRLRRKAMESARAVAGMFGFCGAQMAVRIGRGESPKDVLAPGQHRIESATTFSQSDRDAVKTLPALLTKNRYFVLRTIRLVVGVVQNGESGC